MPKKRRGPQSQLAASMYALNERRTKVWIPFLQAKIADLGTRIEDKGAPEQEG